MKTSGECCKTFLSSYTIYVLSVHTSHLYYTVPRRPPCLAPSPRHSGVQRISRFNIDSANQVRVGTHGSSNGPTHGPSPCDRPSSFSIHFTSIHRLNTNFLSVETHLATSLPSFFLLTKTQLSSWSSFDRFQISTITLFVFILKVVSVLTVT